MPPVAAHTSRLCPPLIAGPVTICAFARSVVIRSFPLGVGRFIPSLHSAAKRAAISLSHFSHHHPGRCFMFCEPATPSGCGLSWFLHSLRSQKTTPALVSLHFILVRRVKINYALPAFHSAQGSLPIFHIPVASTLSQLADGSRYP